MEYFFADYNWIENQISSCERALKGRLPLSRAKTDTGMCFVA
jgi:hypothetical protein